MEVGYSEAFTKIWEQFQVKWIDGAPRVSFLTEFIEEISSYSFISARDINLCLLLGVAFTILRYFLTAAAFKPFFSWCQLLERDLKKSSESAFKFLFYLLVFGYCSYILFNGKYNFYHDTSDCWKGWYKGMPVPQDIYTLYMVEAGFYFHSVYATLFMDLWRRDSILMVAHHILANSLILFSFAIRYHRIGILVLFVHDATDILLEFTKLCIAFKSRGGKYHLLPDVISIVGFLSFALTWGKSRGVEDTREIPNDSVKGEGHEKVANGKGLQNGDLHNSVNRSEATHKTAGQRNFNREGTNNGEPLKKHDKQKENDESGFRRRQPRTKPANL